MYYVSLLEPIAVLYKWCKKKSIAGYDQQGNYAILKYAHFDITMDIKKINSPLSSQIR